MMFAVEIKVYIQSASDLFLVDQCVKQSSKDNAVSLSNACTNLLLDLFLKNLVRAPVYFNKSFFSSICLKESTPEAGLNKYDAK